jgi:hypothetical protein
MGTNVIKPQLRRERNRFLAKHRSENGIASKHVKLRQTG